MMTNSVTFQNFIDTHPNWERSFGVYKRDDDVYKRMICYSDELCGRIHEYHACINTNSGEVYFDCRKRKILAKHITLTFLRPVHTCVKTLWHASIIAPLAVEIFKLLKGTQTIKDLGKNTLRSLADIFRTPAYGIAITITHIVGVILGCISPNTLYKTREIAGKLERYLLRVNTIRGAGIWVLTECFNPIRNIPGKEGLKSMPKDHEIREMLKDFGASAVWARMTIRILFNDCCLLFPQDQRYVSAAKPGTAC
ncbi:MAG: hypothetical protein P4L16_04215 [Chlamydiales bacterium]|nr:hypothetical protein [Chlamydiales bacterium]